MNKFEQEGGFSPQSLFIPDAPLPSGARFIIAGFNYFDWTAPIQHVVLDEKGMDYAKNYYEQRKQFHLHNSDEKIPAAIRAAYDTYVLANGGYNDDASQGIHDQIYASARKATLLSDFYGKKAMLCGEASLFAHRLLSNDIPVHLVIGEFDGESHAFLLAQTEKGIGIFDVNNGLGQEPYFLYLTAEQERIFLSGTLEYIEVEKDGQRRQYAYIEPGDLRVVIDDPLRREQR